MPLTLEIVTPEAKLYSDTIDTVVIPTLMGEIGILPGHIPLLAVIAPGELQVTREGKTEVLAVGGGFVQIEGDRVRILADLAIAEKEIDEKAVEEALARAQSDLEKAKHSDPQEYEHLQGLVRYSGVQLNIKRRSR